MVKTFWFTVASKEHNCMNCFHQTLARKMVAFKLVKNSILDMLKDMSIIAASNELDLWLIVYSVIKLFRLKIEDSDMYSDVCFTI